VRENQSKLEAAYERLLGTLGRQPTDDEVAAEMGISREQLDGLLQDLHAQAVLSLDLPVSEAGGGSDSIADSLYDPGSSPDDVVIREEEQERLARAIDQLPEAERQVISLYYHEGLTMKEVGLVLKVTESRICQIHAKAIARLKAAVRAEEQIPCP
jgi:RNA polymerase sigma factor for flagellar operon FliA